MKILNFNLIKNKRLIWTMSSILIIFSLCGILFSSFYPPINKPINFQKETSIKNITDDLNKILEEMILNKPEQWIWSHNRWK